MVKHIINNYALINNAGTWAKVDHCTTYADNTIDVIRFVTEQAREQYIADNNIVIIEQAANEPV